MIELEKVYDPKQVENKWYDFWMHEKFFHADVDQTKQPYTIVIPPPNVTGVLHMGHALNNTIQDILIRFKKMQGYNTLWMPGTDHAGIATQNVVERKLAKQKKTKHDLGREEFIKEVWQWKEEHGSTIINQLKRLGSACDWDRERFTMDQGLSNAVRKTFVTLYKDNLIYRGNYMINWCPRCATALSDEEAEHKAMRGSIYYLKYPIKDSKEYIVVATTRPETMFGDVAVAVNPKDSRFSSLKGKKIILPIIKKEIPIIEDSFVDPEFGTGIVKVTPAHDPNDFEIGLRHGLKPVNIMNPDATMINTKRYDGMDRFECREALLTDLQELKLLEKIEEHENAVGHCYRCHTVVEPRISEQWFVKMKPLAQLALKEINEGNVKFFPNRWEKVCIEWLENIRDWCISRQIWWGHRIPVWYCKDCGHMMVEMDDPKECTKCKSKKIVQDQDVLDTWFSSWLWPISTLGWPADTQELKYFYPTHTLVTAQEIIFFWVARMIMAGLYFKKQVPFKHVYIHGTVRDDSGKKMSKSLGNTIDPIEIIDQFSADALRFSMIMITAQGQDVFLSLNKFEIGRNFSNKLWNAARFLLSNIPDNLFFENKIPEQPLALEDQWLLSRLNKLSLEVTTALDQYRFNEAARLIYDFTWHDYCDWYIEMVKPRIKEQATQQMLIYVLEKILKILHPIMPFITEELFEKLPIKNKEKSIMLTKYPLSDKNQINEVLEQNFSILKEIIQMIRNARHELNISPAILLKVILKPKNENIKNLIHENADRIKSLARLNELQNDLFSQKPKNAVVQVSNDFEIFLPLEGIIDLAKEKQRLQKNLDKLLEEIKKVNQKLNNENFISKANPEAVAKEQEKKNFLKEKIEKLEVQIKSLE